MPLKLCIERIYNYPFKSSTQEQGEFKPYKTCESKTILISFKLHFFYFKMIRNYYQ